VLDYGDFSAAVAEYDAIARLQGGGAQSLFATQAEARSRQLRGLIELGITSRDERSSGGEAAGALRLAEHFLFQERDTVAALAQYGLVERTFPGTPEAAKACYAGAFVLHRADADPDTTIARYLRVLTTYPGTPQAIGAGEYLGRLGLDELIPAGALDPIAPDTTVALDSIPTVDATGSGIPIVPLPADTLAADTVAAFAADTAATFAPDTLAADTLAAPFRGSNGEGAEEREGGMPDPRERAPSPPVLAPIREPFPSDSAATPDTTSRRVPGTEE
jgi:hypothetical protein